MRNEGVDEKKDDDAAAESADKDNNDKDQKEPVTKILNKAKSAGGEKGSTPSGVVKVPAGLPGGPVARCGGNIRFTFLAPMNIAGFVK